MGCGCRNGGTDKESRGVTLTFLMRELFYDVETYAYVEGDIMEEDGDARLHARHQTQDVGQEGNRDMARRIMDAAHRECVALLYPWAKVSVEDGETRDDVMARKDRYEIVLSVPAETSKSTLDLLESLAHDYMEYKTLWKWLGVTKGAEASSRWKALLDETEERIRDARFLAGSAVRRPLYPAW